MRFNWAEYENSYARLVDSWLDESAVKSTGLDDGWQNFYDYWTEENKKYDNCTGLCFLISENNIPFAVIYLGINGEEMIISEFVVSPDKRGMGYGSDVLSELLANTKELLGKSFSAAEAVIYPDNIASKKAFEKVGFKLVSVHPDGDAINYKYIIDKER